MTFKHGKFEDSVTMRSLVKVAEQKGWVKHEPITKQASVELDLVPTSSLTENVLKLCAGLRQSGMHAYAEEVESKFINYKYANDLYDISGEEGKDLVDAAHPDGSHKMEDMEGDAVIETILDQHLKDMQVVEKKPTGKPVTAFDILKSVRVVLADSQQDKMNSLMDIVRRRAQTITNLTESELTASWSSFSEAIVQFSQNPTIDNLKEIQKIMSRQAWRLKPGLAFGISEDTWAKVSPQINSLNNAVAQAIAIRTSINQETGNKLLGDEAEPMESPTDEEKAKERVGVDTYSSSTKLSKSLESALAVLRGYKASVSADPDIKPEEKTGVQSWLDKKTQQVNTIKSSFTGISDPAEQNSTAQSLLLTLQKITNTFPAFQKEWIG